ncbi:MAG: MFS transporter [Clostridiales bacterium]|nr:MFS transporter [Clostridiales bacterium]
MKSKELKTERRARWSWYFYDFGNSAYASVILLAVYSVYFLNTVVGDADGRGTLLWGVSVAIAAIVVALASPVLGAIADVTKHKKKFLIGTTLLSVVFTALLFFVRQGDVFLGMLFFILAEIGYRAAQVFYDALLSDISTPETIGSISGKGWAMGMVGGILALVIIAVPIQLIGNHIIPFAFIITAIFFLLSSIPTFLWVKEKGEDNPQPHEKPLILTAFKQIGKTFRSIKSYKEFIKYMVAFLIYNDGIMMLMDYAAIIGAILFGLETVQLIIFVILIQATGAIGALLFGKIADWRSSKEATLYSLVILTLSLCGLFFLERGTSSGMTWFFIIGALAGFSLSGAQAVSRGMVVQLAPPEKVTEFYGFLSVAGRTSTFIGPLVFGVLSHGMTDWYLKQGVGENLALQYGVLWGIGSILLFLALGSFLLLFVKRVVAGKKSAQTE